jgi:monovalent cation/hydrogen antiporter
VAGLPWGAAFVLGAIVSATDAVAATAIAERLGLPHRVVVVLSGESLVNDATVLAVLGVAVAAVVEGVFSFGEAVFEFVVGGLGGLVVGLAVGWVLVRLLRFLPDPVLANAAVLLFPFASYLAAEDLHVSGILAVVATGLYAGRKAPTAVSGRTRLQGNLFWEMAVFLLNGFVFVLIGLQLRDILEGLSGYSVTELVLYVALVSLAVVLARVFWVFPATYVPRIVSRRIRERDPAPPWQAVSVIAWCGMRGVISLAAALSLPLVTAEGGPFPGRDLILFLTFSVILATLVLQGLSLPTMIRALGLEDDGSIEREEVRGRVKAAEAALSRVDELALEDWVREDTAERVRALYDYRRRRFSSRYDEDGSGGEDGEDPFGNRGREDYEVRAVAYQRLMYELFRAQREALVRLRDEGEISDEALHRIERDLDLEESRLEI